VRSHLSYDKIGYWSEIKLEIVRKYAKAYSLILNAEPRLTHVYIDAFAGAGMHVAKSTGKFVPGSPLNALEVLPPFKEYHFIDLEGAKIKSLRELASARDNVHLYHGDCNEILLNTVFPGVKWEDYRRALCLLDPYGLHLNWEVIEKAGEMGSIEIFLNFPIADMNRNVLRRDPGNVDPGQIARMNAYWGDDSWRKAAYTTTRNLFDLEEKESNDTVAKAFQVRLREAGGFAYVPDPMPMRNSTGATVYYLFFASQKPVAQKIVSDIFGKYRNRGVV